MGRTKIVKMRFDLTNEYDAATYQRLAETARRAYRRGRGNQANYLVSLMLGARPYNAWSWSQIGLTQIPQFDPEIYKQMANLQAKIEEVSSHIADKLLPKQKHAPLLRLVPTNDENPQQST